MGQVFWGCGAAVEEETWENPGIKRIEVGMVEINHHIEMGACFCIVVAATLRYEQGASRLS